MVAALSLTSPLMESADVFTTKPRVQKHRKEAHEGKRSAGYGNHIFVYLFHQLIAAPAAHYTT